MKQQTNKCKAEPRTPLCPFAGFKPCHGEQCSMWDEDWRICSLNNGSLYSNIRAAVCDAEVEVIKSYDHKFSDDRR